MICISCMNANNLFLQNMGNVCLGILNGSEVGMEELNLIGGRNVVTISFSSGCHFRSWILSLVLQLSAAFIKMLCELRIMKVLALFMQTYPCKTK